MKKLLAWTASADDWVNPVAVKEFRQAVQSRWVIAVLMLFLLINLVDRGRLPGDVARSRGQCRARAATCSAACWSC